MLCLPSPRSLFSSIFVIYSCVIQTQSEVPRPRGVSLNKAPLYSPSKDFTCFDGTVTIPFSYVNDDYCDCFDGSDEPGTSACLNGIFHCTNAGHRPQNLPSSRVNDGVCDCCDGTDEYASSAGCENICENLGKEARAEAERLAELHKAGSKLRIELIENGNKKRQEMSEHLSQLETDKAEAEKIRAERESYKNELEAKENDALKVYREAEEEEKKKKSAEESRKNMVECNDYFNKVDSNNDGILTLDEINTIAVFDRNKNGEVDEDEYKYFFADVESVTMETFSTNTWPLLKPLLMVEQGIFKPPTQNDEETEQDVYDPSEQDTYDPSEQDADDQSEQNTDDGDEENLDDDLPLEETENETAYKNTYDEETQKLIEEASEARRQYTDAERTVREIESNIKNIKENLEKDYGMQQEFATLDGQCFEYEDKEYIYKLCLFQRVTQQSKNGGPEIGLGSWGEWAGDPYKYSAMKYTNGQTCWNGPNRITVVNIMCGLDTKLLSVTEPFRCEYKIELTTPAACDESNATQQHSGHDEL